MPDIPNRDVLENRFARLLGKIQAGDYARLIKLMGKPPDLAKVPLTFWNEVATDSVRVMAPFLETVYLDQAKEVLQLSPIGVDWTLINQGAVTWAHNYAFDLVTHINETSRNGLAAAIQAYFREAGPEVRTTLEQRIASYDEFVRRAGNLFGPTRAEVIAVTEITRASVQGELAIAADLRSQGVNMDAVWETNNDELVCPICAPRNGKKQNDGWADPPPAHPRCRCWINHVFQKV